MTTHTTKPKTTNGRMLPQSCPLEPCLDSDESREKGADRGSAMMAASVPCREERRGNSLPSTEEQSSESNPARARELLRKRKAKAIRFFPFIIRLHQTNAGKTQPIQLKLDPGSKTTGIANTTQKTILLLMEITHRKAEIIKKLEQRSNCRRRRRTANLRCRPARFNNRRKEAGWLPPSIRSIINNITNWSNRLSRWMPITGITIETTKFDAQKMQNPDIVGEEYQRGTLHGWNIWEYLLAKFDHSCVYCKAKGKPLTQDHVIPRAKGGSNRISNLVTACLPCNQKKGSQDLFGFIGKEAASNIQGQLKKSLHSAATMNSMRNGLVAELKAFGLPITLSTGAETKFNRQQFGIPKSHARVAAFTGNSESSKNWNAPTLNIKAQGRGSHQRTKTDALGFPRLRLPRVKMIRGFQPGDIFSTPKGPGRIAVRSTGHFSLNNKGTVKYTICRLLQRADGYNYSTKQGSPIPPHPEGRGILG